MKKICLVCSSGSASFIAEKLMNYHLKKYNLKTIKVFSSCLRVKVGDKTSQKAIFALKRVGVIAKPKLETQLTLSMIDDFDLVITMTRQEKNYLKSKSNVYSLAELIDVNDVSAIQNKTQDEYNQVAEQLEWYIKILVQKLFELEKESV